MIKQEVYVVLQAKIARVRLDLCVIIMRRVRDLLEILIISLFAYAIKEKEKEVRAELFAHDITEYKITCIQALPKEIERKMHGKQFDYAYADRNYISDELGIIREHIRGKQKIELF